EADRMLDMGFMPDIKRILARLPKERQNLLFSATMPADIRVLSNQILRNPAVVQVDRDAPCESVSHALYPVAQHLKGKLLDSLLENIDYNSVLIFTRTKHKARSLGQQLERKGHQATFLQGNLSQSRRQKALDGFRCGDFKIMVATDIAARGIDCSSITHVINFDMPDTAETYTHRIGRTGRAGRTGKAFSLTTPDDNLMVRDIERVLGTQIKRVTVDNFDYSASRPAQTEDDRRNERGHSGRPGGRGGNGRGQGRGNSSGGSARNAGGKSGNSNRNSRGRSAR
ncbi:MAG: DEAD/DEAH box helicase, partial [Proteobacteria bacterium]|nr:DEAD/DEAH box helicase [Pseudomonadota bacterium]MBU1610923.1 DEAD/DEAH box helicase [Pseudomonadota bacterium]